MKRAEQIPRGESLEVRRLMAGDLMTSEALDAFASGQSQAASVVEGAFCASPSSLGDMHASGPKVVYERAEPGDVLDLNRDGLISPADVDTILAQMAQMTPMTPMTPMAEMASQHSAGAATAAAGESIGPQGSPDVNGDGHVTAMDVLQVINRVNAYNSLVPCNCSACLSSAVVDGAE